MSIQKRLIEKKVKKKKNHEDLNDGNEIDICIKIRKILYKLIKEKKNIINISSELTGIFTFIPNPNEFAGPLVEGWAHIFLKKKFDDYEVPESGKQTFEDSTLIFKDKKIYLNIKAKSKDKLKRSRTNLSSLKRFYNHYKNNYKIPYIIATFIYEAKIKENKFEITINNLQVFDILEIPRKNFKIEGAYEGSFRIFISPLPDFLKKGIYGGRTKLTPQEFLEHINNLRINWLKMRASKKEKV